MSKAWRCFKDVNEPISEKSSADYTRLALKTRGDEDVLDERCSLEEPFAISTHVLATRSSRSRLKFPSCYDMIVPCLFRLAIRIICFFSSLIEPIS